MDLGNILKILNTKLGLIDNMKFTKKELLIVEICKMLKGLNHVAVGAFSPIPAAACLLSKKLNNGVKNISILGSENFNFFTNGGTELFDCAAQGRIDAFFLSGGQIDGEANINLVGLKKNKEFYHRFSGSYGSAFLYFIVPKIILFREEHNKNIFVKKVDYVSAPGINSKKIYRKGKVYRLITGKGIFNFNYDISKFELKNLHPGESLSDIKKNTGFPFKIPEIVPFTEDPTNNQLQILRNDVTKELKQIYPRFVEEYF